MLVCIACRPSQTHGATRTINMQEVARLEDGEPTIVLQDGVKDLPDETVIFSGNNIIAAENIPHVSDARTSASINSNLLVAENFPKPEKNGKINNSAMAEQAKALSSVSPTSSSDNLILCTAEIELQKHAYVAPSGCAFISDTDLTFIESKNKDPVNILVICAPKSIATFPLDAETLESFGLYKDGKSLVSTVQPGPEASVAIYTGDSFDGKSFVVNYGDPNVAEHKFFDSNSDANDKVKSIMFHSTATSTPKSCKEVKRLVGFKQPK